jgi:putative two-component system response regulator
MQAVAHDLGGAAMSSPRPQLIPGLPEESTDGAATAREARERPLVLVVDDEDAIRLLCRVNLRLEGMDTAEAGDGGTALALARELRPDLILLDVMMPQVDGWQVAEEIGRDPAIHEVPIVFLSARAEPADYLHGYDLGAVGYVTKPFDPTALGAILHDVLVRLGRGEREALRRERLEELAERREG